MADKAKDSKRFSDYSFVKEIAELIAALPNNATTLLIIAATVAGSMLLTPSQWQWLLPAVQMGLSAASLYWIVTVLAKRFAPPAFNEPVMAAACGAVVPRTPLSAEEHRRCAIHEAGHLLALALLPKPPSRISAYVRDYVATPTGNVSWSLESERNAEIEWAVMLFDLAGQMAEKTVYGEVKHGSAVDNKQWEQHARAYLASYQQEHAWFIEPQTAAEAEVNHSTLRRLREQQEAELSGFLSANEAQLKTVAATLESGPLDTEAALTVLGSLVKNGHGVSA